MATVCFSVIRGKMVRVTALDECGVPEVGNSFVVSKGFVQVSLTSELETGDEIIVKNANGELCINDRVPDSLKRLNVAIDWCNVDPDVISIITGYPVEIEGEDTVGFRINEGFADTNWGLEVWTGLGSQQACDAAGALYGWVLVPYITGSTFGGSQVISAAAATFQTTGYTQGNSGWGVGPYDVIGSPPAPLTDPVGPLTHAVIRTTPVAPPVDACGAQTITSPVP